MTPSGFHLYVWIKIILITTVKKKSFKDIVITTSESFPGISGKIKLNEAGDRNGGNYDFWIVYKDIDNNNDHYRWKVENVSVLSNNTHKFFLPVH